MRRFTVAVLLLLSGCAQGARTATDSGIQGRVLLGPQCPVVSEASPCPDEPVAADVLVMNRVGDEVTRVRSGFDGRFRVGLEPGSYVVQALVTGEAMFAKPVDVTVRPGAFVSVDVLLDTGIREPVAEG